MVRVKTIWFCEEINKRKIKLFKIETKEQLGDIFTKSLPKFTFEYLRKKNDGIMIPLDSCKLTESISACSRGSLEETYLDICRYLLEDPKDILIRVNGPHIKICKTYFTLELVIDRMGIK